MHPLDLAKRIALIISHKEMDDIIEVVRSLKDAGLLIKCVSQTIINEAKEQKVGFLIMLLRSLGACLLGNLLTGKGAKKLEIPGRGVVKLIEQNRNFNATSSFN